MERATEKNSPHLDTVAEAACAAYRCGGQIPDYESAGNGETVG